MAVVSAQVDDAVIMNNNTPYIVSGGIWRRIDPGKGGTAVVTDGQTTVSAHVYVLGIVVIDCDAVGRRLTITLGCETRVSCRPPSRMRPSPTAVCADVNAGYTFDPPVEEGSGKQMVGVLGIDGLHPK